jgi:hypothetical protein
MGSSHPDTIDFAGDYNLNGVILQNHAGTGGKFGEGGVNIQSIVQELNIYEGINQSAVFGTMVVVDSTNIIGNLPIQGTERLMFKLSTPGASKTEHIIDASEQTGHPFYVYKISNKKQPSQGTLVYTIHFASREFLRNLRVKVSQAYEGKLSDMVSQIIGDKEGLDSRKKLYYEETANSDKIVIPNLSPFNAISLIKKRAIPGYTKGVGYYFYETTKGFYFQSWENMCASYGSREKPIIQQFFYKPQNITDDKIEDKTLDDLSSVESYKFLNTSHDVAAAQALGTYGHKVISYNLYDKSFNTSEYHYHDQFNDTIHADFTNEEGSANKHAVRGNPVDYDNRSLSDYADSMVSLIPTTQFLHSADGTDDSGSFGTDVNDDARLEGIRNGMAMQIQAGTVLQLTVKGQSYIQPGHVIDFNLRPVEEEGMTSDKKTYDPQYSGRYVITKIRHRVTKQDYKMILECRKDSVREKLPGQDVRNFTGIANNENAQYQNLTDSNYGSIATTGKTKRYGL